MKIRGEAAVPQGQWRAQAVSELCAGGQDCDGGWAKQDCELKGVVRLAAKLKKAFPGLPICILTDGLYPNQTVFECCKNNGWKYIITLKDGTCRTCRK